MPKAFHPKYDRQIIFTLSDPDQPTGGGYGESIRAKAERHYDFRESTRIVPLIVPNHNNIIETPALVAACLTIDKRTRIYIRGHCSPGSYSLSTDLGRSVTCKNLSLILAKHIRRNSDVFVRGAQKLKISLSGCSAGVNSCMYPVSPDVVNNSFAANFLYNLNYYGINCVIAARMGDVTINNYSGEERFNVQPPSTEMLYAKLVKDLVKSSFSEAQIREIHARCHYPVHDPRAKVFYQYNDAGIQEMLSPDSAFHFHPIIPTRSSQACNLGWRDERQITAAREALIDLINDCMIQTRSEAKQRGLCRLLDDIFKATSDSNIYGIIRTELAAGEPGRYEVNTHSNVFTRLLGSKTRTHEVLAAWLRSYQR